MRPNLKVPFFSIALLLLLLGAATHSLPAQTPPVEGMYDVRNGDQTGKLIIKDSEVAFESLTDGRHSRTWKYSEIREITKKGSGFRIRPFKGSRYDFQLKDNQLRDRLYSTIAERVVLARQSQRK